MHTTFAQALVEISTMYKTTDREERIKAMEDAIQHLRDEGKDDKAKQGQQGQQPGGQAQNQRQAQAGQAHPPQSQGQPSNPPPGSAHRDNPGQRG